MNTPGSVKPKLTFQQMIIHLESKNIRFDKIEKTEVTELLKSSNYFYKMTAYRKNFEKNNRGLYVNLDFILLRDLSTIDMRLRYVVLQMCLDIEHALKTKILAEITEDANEDGYTIVNDFFQSTGVDIEKLTQPLKRDSHYNYGLYQKYNKNWPVWALFEILMFSDFLKFVDFYYVRNGRPRAYTALINVLKFVKNIRNIAAHNSPILIDIARKNQINAKKISRPLTEFTRRITSLSDRSRTVRLTNKKVHDLTALFYVYHTFIKSKNMKDARYKELKLVLDRAKQNKDHYINQDAMIAVYIYFKKMIDFMTANS